MKQNIKSAWAKALRENRYTVQNINCLKMKSNASKTGYLYDPFGVLCELFVEKGKATWVASNSVIGDVWWIDGENAFGVSENVARLAGFDIDYEGEDEKSVLEALMHSWDADPSVSSFVDRLEQVWELL